MVVVVELLAAHELLKFRRRAEPVDPELALDELGVRVRPLPRHAVDAERLHLPADVDRPVVHRVAEPRPDVAEDHLATALHHEPGHRPRVPHHDHRPALLVDPRARADLALDHDVAPAYRRSRQRARVAVHDHDAGHHVLEGRPADAARDVDLGAVDQAAAEIPERAREGDAAASEDPDAERVLRAGVLDRDVLDALLVEQPPQLEVDLPRRKVVRVEARAVPVGLGDARRLRVRLREPAGVIPDSAFPYRCHASTTPSYGSYVSISWSMIARI